MRAERQVFNVEGTRVHPLTLSQLQKHNIKEADLERWVVENPQILGPGVQIVATQYDEWSLDSGERQKSRLDILAVDPSSQLIVVELKRESDSKIHLQAITYAAMVASFDQDTLSRAHADWLNLQNPEQSPITPENAWEELERALNREEALDPSKFSRPKIILIAESYAPQVYTTVKWLTSTANFGIDIEIHIASLFSATVDDSAQPEILSLTFQRQFPEESIEDRILSAGLSDEAIDPITNQIAREKRSRNSVEIIRNFNLVEDGQLLHLNLGTFANEYERSAVDRWIADNSHRGTAIWSTSGNANLRWSADSNPDTPWSPTGLAKHIIKQATGGPEKQSIQGPSVWWRDERSLSGIATDFQKMTSPNTETPRPPTSPTSY